MKRLSGVSVNINSVIIGKITRKKRRDFFSKRKFILITDDLECLGYATLLLGSSNIKNKVHNKVVHSVNNLDQLADGDIVEIYPNGEINVVYEINSIHNSLFLTDRCNSNCIMCPQPPNNTVPDNFNNVVKILSLMDKSTRSIGITGGEPTLLGDKLFELLKIVKNRLPGVSITLLTNAIKLADFEYARGFAEINYADIQIDVPLFSDTDTEHNKIVRSKSFYKSILGLYNLAKLDQKVGIRVVVHKMNYKRLPQISEFIYRNFPFVVQVAFMQMEPVGYAKDNIDLLWIDPHEYNTELENAVGFLTNFDLNVLIFNSQLCILPKNLRKFACKSISTWKNIYINECTDCDLKQSCPGFFASSLDIHSKYIKPIKNSESI